MREIVHIQAGQCGNQIGSKVCSSFYIQRSFHIAVIYQRENSSLLFTCSNKISVL